MRNPYISFLQAFGIILVVVGHAFPTHGHHNLLYQWIYSFHMPLWVFLSGYLLRYTAPPTPQGTCPLAAIRFGGKGGFLDKKVRRLLVPYLLISTLVFLPKVWLSPWAVKPVALSWGAYFEMLLVPARNVIVYYWFLPTIFILLVGTVLLAKGVARVGLGGRLPLWGWIVAAAVLALWNPLGGVQWLNLGGVVKFSFYFALGMAYCSYQDEIDRNLYFGAPWTTLGWGITSVLAGGFGMIPHGGVWEMLTAVSGILFSLSLGHTYLQSGKTILAPLDGATYAIFLFSWFPQSALRVVMYDYGHLSPWIGVPLSTAAGLALPWLLWRALQYGKRWPAGRNMAQLLGQ